ncbi:MAG: NUDIX hydrolase [Pseudoxanthomonas sp.]
MIDLAATPSSATVPGRANGHWQPDVTVATVVVRDGRLLMVEEYAGGRRPVLNQPAGHLEPDESLLDAAVRETREETGWTVRPTGFLGAWQWTVPGQGGPDGRHFLRMAFCAEPLSHDPDLRLDDGIVRALWMTPAELRQASGRHRSPLVWRTAETFLAGRRLPLDVVERLA